MQRRWLEPGFLIVILTAATASWIFLALASEVSEGEADRLDFAILSSLHSASDPHGSDDPPWLREFARDVTGLGSAGVLGILVAATCAFLAMAGRRRTSLFVLLTSIASWGANALLKLHFNRPRPTLIDHGMQLATSSFPSGHAMLSATVYLTLAAILSRLTPSLRLKLCMLTIAAVLSGLVGVSRVYLGVHWPSDVVAGWAAGSAWALIAWSLADRLHLGSNEKQ